MGKETLKLGLRTLIFFEKKIFFISLRSPSSRATFIDLKDRVIRKINFCNFEPKLYSAKFVKESQKLVPQKFVNFYQLRKYLIINRENYFSANCENFANHEYESTNFEKKLSNCAKISSAK